MRIWCCWTCRGGSSSIETGEDGVTNFTANSVRRTSMKIPKIYPYRRDGQELRGRERSQKSESFSGEFHETACAIADYLPLLRRTVNWPLFGLGTDCLPRRTLYEGSSYKRYEDLSGRWYFMQALFLSRCKRGDRGEETYLSPFEARWRNTFSLCISRGLQTFSTYYLRF